MRHFRGSKHTLTPSTYFQGVKTRNQSTPLLPPTSMTTVASNNCNRPCIGDVGSATTSLEKRRLVEDLVLTYKIIFGLLDIDSRKFFLHYVV